MLEISIFRKIQNQIQQKTMLSLSCMVVSFYIQISLVLILLNQLSIYIDSYIIIIILGHDDEISYLNLISVRSSIEHMRPYQPPLTPSLKGYSIIIIKNYQSWFRIYESARSSAILLVTRDCAFYITPDQQSDNCRFQQSPQ